MPTTTSGKKIHVVHDVCYHPLGPAVASSAHYLDVYFPQAESAADVASLPVVVFLHGGGWRRGSRRSNIFHFFQNVGLVLADLGFVAVLPSYRKSLPYAPWLLGMMGATALTVTLTATATWCWSSSTLAARSTTILRAAALWGALSLTFRQIIRWACPGVRHPSHLEDCALALSWVRSGATRAFGGDPQKLVLLGNSAGAHLAAMLLLEPSHRASTAAPGCPAQVRGLISISGIYSGPRFYQNWLTRHMFGYVFDDHPNWDDCFPAAHCPDPTSDPTTQLCDLCPILLINAAFDVGLQAHAHDFAERLRHGGAQVEGPVVLPGTDHFRMLPMLGSMHRHGTASREDRSLVALGLLGEASAGRGWLEINGLRG